MTKQYRFISILLAVGICMNANAQPYLPPNYNSGTTPLNYVKVLEPTAPFANVLDVLSTSRTVEEVKKSTQYFDGLGRPIQTVSWQSSPLKKDLVAPQVYDGYGRETHQYLPYVATDNTGTIKYDPFTAQQTFNNTMYGSQGETFFYNQTNFEASPLSRPIKSMAAGNSWVGNNKGVEMEYHINTADDGVRKWTIANTSAAIPTTTTTYPAGELIKTITKDEHGKQVVEYKDKEGKVILKQVQIDNTIGNDHLGYLSTYYIYNVYGELRFVIQPLAVKKLKANNWSFTNIPNSNSGAIVRDELCFYYEYDLQGRMIVKKVPGAGEVYMVYDERDRLVMTQDANLRNPPSGGQGGWMVTLYDALNRPTKTGIWTEANNRAYHQGIADAQTTTIAYPFTTEPTTGWELLTQTGYDSYSNLPSASGLTATLDNSVINSTNFVTTYNTAPQYAQPIAATTTTKGMPTWTMVKVLNGATNAQYLYTLTIYDEYGRPIQTKATNITGGTDIATMQYDFSGKVLRTHQQHQKAGNNANTYQVLTKPSYDHMGRVMDVKKTINATGSPAIAGVEKTIAVNSYNELGQLKTKKLAADYNGGAGLENLNYDYNIRGWLLGMNRDFINNSPPPGGGGGGFFGFELGYDKASTIVSGQNYTKQFLNGNIGGTVWKSRGDSEIRKFDYRYDNANRLLWADFNQYTNGSFNQTAGINFDVKIGDGSLLPDGSIDYTKAYDENGNILEMRQNGLKGLTSTGIDKLFYTYKEHSNKLLNVIDINNDAGTKLGDFRTSLIHPNQSKTNTTVDYTYDDNGNLKKDLNKDIGNATTDGVVYNYLNLPQTITVRKDANGANIKGIIEYVYDATGNKLQKKTNEYPTTSGIGVIHTTTTTYTSGFVYESKTNGLGGDALQYTGHEEGRIRLVIPPSGGQGVFVYDYMLKDHLGNVRMVLTDEAKQDAYPPATLETNNIVAESNFYGNLQSTQVAKPSWFSDPMFEESQKVSRVRNDNSSLKIGPDIMLKVMAGDRFNVRVAGGWSSTVTNQNGTTNDMLNDLLSLVSNSLATSSGGKATVAELQNPGSGLSGGLLNFLNGQTTASANRPRSYLNWILFDERFKIVETSSGFVQVGKNTVTTEIEVRPNLPINKNGYLYIYTSNQSQNVDVFFDNLQVTHIRGRILEETHYYPFGLTMAGISSKAANMPTNKIKYQQYELNTDFDINLYESFYRSHDPQLGRFWQVDPKPNEFESPYAAMGNNPIKNMDILGDTTWTTTTVSNNGKTITNTTHVRGKTLDLADVAITRGSGCNTKTDGIAEVTTAINQRFNGQKTVSVDAKGVTTITNFDVQYEVAKSMGEVKPSDHLLVFVDDVKGKSDTKLGGGDAGGLAKLYGKIAYVEDSNNFNFLVENSIHEIGHNMGLEHYENGSGNFMSYDNDRSKFTPWQITMMYNMSMRRSLNEGTNREVSNRSSNNWFYHTSTNEKPYYKNVSIGDIIPLILKNL